MILLGLILAGQAWATGIPHEFELIEVKTGKKVTVTNCIRWNGICPVCEKEGKKSEVYSGAATATLLAPSRYYDENGKYHVEDPNTYTINYSCSRGHQFSVSVCRGKETVSILSTNALPREATPTTTWITNSVWVTMNTNTNLVNMANVDRPKDILSVDDIYLRGKSMNWWMAGLTGFSVLTFIIALSAHWRIK